MSYPLVSILIPVYNREHLISKTLDSALAQTYSNVEVVVVDNCSSDATWQIIREYECKDIRIKAFRNETNIGPVKNWRRCVDNAHGEYGKILWSDDLISPDFLDKTVFALSRSDVGFAYTVARIFNEDSTKGCECFSIGPTGFYDIEQYVNGVLFLPSGYPVSPGCALFRLKDLESNIMVNVPNKIGSDFSMHAIGNDLLVFLLTAIDYKKMYFVNEPLSFFRAHSDSITISSGKGKTVYHYNLAKAYFVDTFRPDMRRKFASLVLLDMVKYRTYRTYRKYNIRSLADFFISRDLIMPDISSLLEAILKKLALKAKKIFPSQVDSICALIRRFKKG